MSYANELEVETQWDMFLASKFFDLILRKLMLE